LILTNLSCASREPATAENSNLPNELAVNSQFEIPPHNDPSELVEFFIDDSHIGQPRKNRLEISNYKQANGNLAVINFYSRSPTKQWKLKQTFKFEKDGLTDCDPRIEDFNNDGIKDFTYVSNVAARGANEVRKPFIYDRQHDQLVYIKNSENYPNMVYNRSLNCIDAWLFHGATTTVFLRIEGDVLREFASVETGLERVVTVTDREGKETVLRREKMTEEDIYTRYIRFNPPQPYQ